MAPTNALQDKQQQQQQQHSPYPWQHTWPQPSYILHNNGKPSPPNQSYPVLDPNGYMLDSSGYTFHLMAEAKKEHQTKYCNMPMATTMTPIPTAATPWTTLATTTTTIPIAYNPQHLIPTWQTTNGRHHISFFSWIHWTPQEPHKQQQWQQQQNTWKYIYNPDSNKAATWNNKWYIYSTRKKVHGHWKCIPFPVTTLNNWTQTTTMALTTTGGITYLHSSTIKPLTAETAIGTTSLTFSLACLPRHQTAPATKAMVMTPMDTAPVTKAMVMTPMDIAPGGQTQTGGYHSFMALQATQTWWKYQRLT
jgi:hypothetical protein